MPIFIQKIISVFIILLTLPLWPILFIAVKIDSPGKFIFRQKRAGKNKKTFTMYKIRTMTIDAETQKKQIIHLNEADGPVFKIKNDPRYTGIGKILAKTAIDELPQLINVIRGEMALVGPRPLPIEEAKKVPEKYSMRFSVLPGMTSSWIVSGGHKLSFDKWMQLDIHYAKNRSSILDLQILIKTLQLITASILKKGT